MSRSVKRTPLSVSSKCVGTWNLTEINQAQPLHLIDLRRYVDVPGHVTVYIRLFAQGAVADIHEDVYGLRCFQKRTESGGFDHVVFTLVEMNVGPRPLNSGDPFSLQVSVSCALSTREQMYSIFAFCVQPFVISFYGSQLLMSLMATMMAMITMSTTRMMSR